MKATDFSKGTGRLVKAQAQIKGKGNRIETITYMAFVPDPLPPQLDLSPRLVQAIADASLAVGELRGLGRMLPNPHLMISPLIRREAVVSSRIEGTQASMTDVYAFEAEQLSLPILANAAPVSDVREVVNYVRALEYGLSMSESRPVSLGFIQELHRLLMTGVRGEDKRPGECRVEQNWIGDRDSGLQDARFVPPPPLEMRASLDLWAQYIAAPNDSFPPLVRLALVHYQFEAIHPFVDGNGRIGRLLIALLMVHWKLLPLPLLYVSAFFEQHRREYYDLLLAVSREGAWEDWVHFFLRGVEEQANDAVTRAKRVQDLQNKWRSELTESGARGRLIRLVDELFTSPVMTIARAQEILGVSYTAASNNVEKLVDLGILSELPTTYRRLFIAMAVMETIEGPINEVDLAGP